MVDRYCVFGHRCVVFQTSEPERTPVLSLLFAFFFFSRVRTSAALKQNEEGITVHQG